MCAEEFDAFAELFQKLAILPQNHQYQVELLFWGQDLRLHQVLIVSKNKEDHNLLGNVSPFDTRDYLDFSGITKTNKIR